MASSSHLPQQKLFQFAVHLWEVYERSRKRSSAASIHWPVDKLSSIYTDFFKEPLKLSDYGVHSLEGLLEKVPIFIVGAANKVSISKEKLINFLVVHAVGSDCVNEKRFRERFVEVTGLQVEILYTLLKKKNFIAFAQSLCAKSSLFNVKGGGSTIQLFIPKEQQTLFSEHQAIRSGSPVITVKSKRNRTDTSHPTSCSDSPSGTSESDFDPPPYKLHCAAVDSSSSISQPIPVQVSERQESSSLLLGQPDNSLSMSATRDSRASHNPVSQTRRHDGSSQSLSHPYTDSDFPPLGAQIPPRFPASGRAYNPNLVPASVRGPLLPPGTRELTLPLHAASGGANLHSTYASNLVPASVRGPLLSTGSRELTPPLHAASRGANLHSTYPPNLAPASVRELTPPLHAASRGANLHSAYTPNLAPASVRELTPPLHAASGGANLHSAYPLSSPDSRAVPSPHPSTPPPSKLLVFPNPDAPDEVVLPAHPNFHPNMDTATTTLPVSLTFKDKRGRPNSPQEAVKKISARIEAIIDDLVSTGKFVPEPVVRKFLDQLIQQCRRAGCSFNPRDIRTFDKYSKTHGRIAELIRIFCWMSPITSLYELNRALVASESVSTFEELRLGPLIKHPSVAKFFQPPPDLQDIPEITAHQIQKVLMKFLDKTRKAAAKGEKHSVEDFLEFFAKHVSKPSPHHLCVRITSFPLAIQTNSTFRRMQRESRNRVQYTVDEEMKTIVTHEIDQVRRKLASFNDPLAVSRHVTAKDPIVLLTDIFEIFLAYLSGYQSAKVEGFLQLLSNPNHQWVRQMFMLAIYRGAYGVEKGIGEIREELPQSNRKPEQILHKPHGEILDIVLRHLSQMQYPIDLSSLAAVEKATADYFGAPSFQVLNNVSFLNFLISDKRCKSSLGGALTIGAAPIDDGRKKTTMDIVSQLRAAERSSQDAVTETLKLQCGVASIDHIYCGSIEKLINDVAMHKKEGMAHQRCVMHLTPLLVNGANDSNLYKQWSCPSVGVFGHKTCDDAVTCLKRAPLLEDLAYWSHWDLVFKPQHGELAKFIEREGPQNGLHALEIASGTLLRVDPEASHQKFLEAVEAMDPVNTAGELVSIVVQQGSVHELSVQLLGNHVQTALERLVSDSAGSTEGTLDGTQLAAQFIYQCLIRIPHKISHFLAKEVFLEPLRKVSSNSVVEDLLNQSRRAESGVERRHLQALGMGLGIKAWADDFSVMLDEAENTGVLKPSSAPTIVEPYSMDGPTSIDLELTGTHPTTSSPMPTDMDLATVPEDQVNTSLPLSEAVDTENEVQCRAVVDNIRSEEFGIGLKLDGHQKEVAEKQRQREGRGLQRLSKELYSKDTHFVLELIQNADDNSYHKSLLMSSSEDVPALKFIVGPSSVVVLNNELGFSEKNVHAICDVGRSTKGAHHSGYIGQKGIGFKSVFRVTDKPEIHSGGYHIRFDAQCDAIGYILPHWVEQEDRESAAVGTEWSTTIVLPLKADRQAMSLVTKFQDVRPSLLLFLHRLRSITVEHQETGTIQYMRRFDGEKGIIKIKHNTNSGQDKADVDTWLVVRKQLTNASQFKVDVEATEVALAFPLSSDMKTVVLAKDLQHQQVFAFLPLRSYGFRFIVQGDFDLPSSREDVNRDSAWNQWIRDEIPQLFLHAIEKIKKLPELTPTVAVALYLQFVPLDGELHDFFKPVAIQILNLLRGTACLPTEPGSDHIDEPFSIIQKDYHKEPDESSHLHHLWKQPSQLVVVRDDYIRKHIPQSLLNSALHLFYLSSEITPFLNAPLQSQLGIHNLSIDHLITIAEAVLKSYSGESQDVIMLSDSDDDSLCSDDEESESGSGKKITTSHAVFVQWVTYWLACVHIVLEEEGDRNPLTVNKLKKIKIIPLTNGTRLAVQDGSLFFPADGDSVDSTEFKGLFDEIMVVDPRLFESQRGSSAGTLSKPSFRVHSVLELLGVREIYPAEVIRHHILPCFQNEQWKSKSKAILTTYLVYIKDSIGMQGSGVTETEMVSLLKDCVALATKRHGARQPAKEVLHFSSQFQPSYDFEKLFPDVQWMLVSPDYLKSLKSRQDILSWRRFLQKLGVQNIIAVKKFNESVPEGSKQWNELKYFVGRSPDGSYTLQDYKCIEFEEIVQSVGSKKQGYQQMLELVKLLDKLWDEEYKRCAYARCYDGSNTTYIGGDTTVPSSFHKALKDLPWLPAIYFPSRQPYGKDSQLFRGRDLFDGSKANQALLDCHVPYIAVDLKNHSFLELLQVKCSINADEMIAFLQEWSKASTIPGTQFRASIVHMTAVYTFLYTSSYQGVMGGQDIQDKFSSSDLGLIFVPDEYNSSISSAEHVVGHFYSIHNVCWMDRSTVLYAKQKWNHSLPPELPKVLQLYYGVSEEQYQEIKIAFQHFGVREVPTAAAYINTLQHIGSLAAIPEKHHISDFTSIALHLSLVCMEGHITPQFLEQSLKERKVFPSHRGLWVSLDSCLLERDDAQLAKHFAECEDVHFLQWSAELFQKKSSKRYQPSREEHEEERKHFIEVCGIAKLSDVIETRVEPKGTVMPLESLRKQLSIMVPLIQKYLIANEELLYQSLQQENIKEKLSKMLIFSVIGLDCLYSIHHHGISIHSPTMSSPGSEFTDSTEEDTATLYVAASKVESPKCLVPTLIKIFTGKKIGFQDTRNFETLVKDMLLSPTEEIESILSDPNYSFAEVSDNDVWRVPVYEEPEPDASESEDDEDNSVDENDASATEEKMEAVERGQSADSDGLKSWPPKAPPAWTSSSTQHPAKPPPPGSSVADVVDNDDIKKISEKYAMVNKTTERSLSRQTSHGCTQPSDLSQPTVRDVDHNKAPISAHPQSLGPSSVQPSLSHGINQQTPDSEGSRHLHDNVLGIREGTNLFTRGGGTTGGGGMNHPSHKKDQNWHESTKPEVALMKSSFSIASALQSISVGSDCPINLFPEEFDQESRDLVGRWGEEYVYKYLGMKKQLPEGQLIQTVTWINEKLETGKPYDIEVKIAPDTVIYIEVKSTKTSNKELIEFSWNELQFAEREKKNYHLYRVYNAGSTSVNLKWMENLSNVLDRHPVRLLLEL